MRNGNLSLVDNVVLRRLRAELRGSRPGPSLGRASAAWSLPAAGTTPKLEPYTPPRLTLACIILQSPQPPPFRSQNCTARPCKDAADVSTWIIPGERPAASARQHGQRQVKAQTRPLCRMPRKHQQPLRLLALPRPRQPRTRGSRQRGVLQREFAHGGGPGRGGGLCIAGVPRVLAGYLLSRTVSGESVWSGR